MARRILSSKIGLAVAAVAVLAASGAGFWYRQQILDAYAASKEQALTTLSLGLFPALAWIAAFAVIMLMARSWRTRISLGASSLFALAGVLGLMSFFEVHFGSLSWATLGGEVSLGGRIGEAIAGTQSALAWARVAALFVIAAAVAAPSAALFTARAGGGFALGAYAAIALGVGKAASAIGGMRREKPAPAPAEQEIMTPASSAELSELLRPQAIESEPLEESENWEYQETSAAETDSWEYQEIDEAVPSVAEESALEPAAVLAAEQPLAGTADTLEQQIESLPPILDEPQPAGARFNKFWQSETAPLATRQGITHYQDLGGDDDEEMMAPFLGTDSESWSRPSMDILHDVPEGGITDEEMSETAETIKTTLGDYGVEVEVEETHPGPTVTMYGLVPGWVRRYKQVKATDEAGRPKLNEAGKPIVSRVETKTRVKVDAITSREKDLSLALRTSSIRIETPVMGKSLVGVEVPNPNPSLVTLRGVMEGAEYRKLLGKAKLPVALGKGSGGEAVVIDLAKMPHLLVAGATGSGKSVCINTILSGLIMEKTPEDLRLLLIDPKRVELTPYNGIPHLLTPVVVETDEVVGLLKGLIAEMMNRYRRMEEVGVRNIDSYNRKAHDRMPYLVVAVDELADLMMTASFDVEQSLCRLAQMGRATGIHLIVATQRPSVDVVTGLIKANFPSRISFGVTSQIDSRTILDTAGAEKLLGKGDMLYQAVDASRPGRVQGVFISDSEVEDLVEFWQTTPRGPLPEVSLHTSGDGDEEGDKDDGDEDLERDEMLNKAIELAQKQKKLSTSLLQRRLRIGYPRAARLMDQLEEEGIVGPGDGSKSRDVIISV